MKKIIDWGKSHNPNFWWAATPLILVIMVLLYSLFSGFTKSTLGNISPHKVIEEEKQQFLSLEKTVDSLKKMLAVKQASIKNLKKEKNTLEKKNVALQKKQEEISEVSSEITLLGERLALLTNLKKAKSTKALSLAQKQLYKDKFFLIKKNWDNLKIPYSVARNSALALCLIVEGRDGGNVKCFAKHDHKAAGEYRAQDEVKFLANKPKHLLTKEENEILKGATIYEGKLGFWFKPATIKTFTEQLSKPRYRKAMETPNESVRFYLTGLKIGGWYTAPSEDYINTVSQYLNDIEKLNKEVNIK